MGEAREIMDRITEAAMSNDTEALKALYAPDAVAETPDQGTINGRDEIVAYMSALPKAFPDVSYEPIQKHEVGANAIDEGYLVGTHTGPLASPDGETIEATGKRVRVRGCDVATVEGGAVTSHRFYFDNMDFLGQLGLLPATIPEGAGGDAAAGTPEEAGRKAKLPLVLGATALAGLAGWIVIARRTARRTVLGVRRPRAGSRSAAKVLGDGARDMPGVRRVRRLIAGRRRRIGG